MDYSCVLDPIVGNIRLPEFKTFINDPKFIRQDYIKQLGTLYFIFPGATHTRFLHALGSGHRTFVRVQRYDLTKIICKSLIVFALGHDIGHGPYSHVLEKFMSKNHKKRTIEILFCMRKQIQDCGADFDLVMDLAQKKNPLHKIVSDKNFGTDKFDYLHRDTYFTGTKGLPDLEHIEHHVLFDGQEMYVDFRVLAEAIELQRYYIKMYAHVYMRPSHLIIAYAMRKFIFLLIKQGFITPFQLEQMKDHEVDALLKDNNVFGPNFHLFNIQSSFRPILTLKLLKTPHDNSKHYYVEKEIFQKIKPRLTDFDDILKLEEETSKIIGCANTDVVCVPKVDHYRFVPQDIKVRLLDGSFNCVKNIYPKHIQALQEMAEHLSEFKICLSKRIDISEKHIQKLYEFLLKWCNEV